MSPEDCCRYDGVNTRRIVADADRFAESSGKDKLSTLGVGVAAAAAGTFVLAATSGFIGSTVALTASNSVWAVPAVQRGVEIEQRLGANLPGNFPVIDRFANGVATSIKSLDLGAKTYQNAGALLNTLNGYVNSLASFAGRTWGGVSVVGSDISQRVLQVAVPGSMTPTQAAAFQQAAARAAEMGVTVTTTIIR